MSAETEAPPKVLEFTMHQPIDWDDTVSLAAPQSATKESPAPAPTTPFTGPRWLAVLGTALGLLTASLSGIYRHCHSTDGSTDNHPHHNHL